MATEQENEVRRILDDVMGSSVNWPPNFKKVLPAWLEISQPAFHLNQLIGWQSYVGNNGSFPCTSPLSLTTTPVLVPGMTTTLFSAGTYLITANMEATLAATTADTGATFGASATTVDRGFLDWVSPSNVLADDGAVASISAGVSNTETDYLVVSDFFDIPSAATVVGIALAFEARNFPTANDTWHSQLRKAGVLAGTDDTSLTNTSLTVENHGGSTDLWGTTWTAAELSASNFGVAIWGVAGVDRDWEIDYVTLTAYLSGLSETVTGYLYVDGVAEAATITIPLTSATTSTATATWFITTTADDVDIEFRAEKTYDITDADVTTNSQLIVVRLS